MNVRQSFVYIYEKAQTICKERILNFVSGIKTLFTTYVVEKKLVESWLLFTWEPVGKWLVQ